MDQKILVTTQFLTAYAYLTVFLHTVYDNIHMRGEGPWLNDRTFKVARSLCHANGGGRDLSMKGPEPHIRSWYDDVMWKWHHHIRAISRGSSSFEAKTGKTGNKPFSFAPQMDYPCATSLMWWHHFHVASSCCGYCANHHCCGWGFSPPTGWPEASTWGLTALEHVIGRQMVPGSTTGISSWKDQAVYDVQDICLRPRQWLPARVDNTDIEGSIWRGFMTQWWCICLLCRWPQV